MSQEDDQAENMRTSIASLRLFQEYHWLMVAAFWKPSGELLGEPGRRSVERGFYAAGLYNGRAMHDSALALAEGRSPIGVFRHWESAEWHLASADGHLEADRVADGIRVRVAELPGHDYAIEHGIVDGLRAYWAALFAGVVRGYDASLEARVEVEPDTGAAVFEVREQKEIAEAEDVSELLLPLTDEVAGLNRTRRTTGLLASLQLYPSRQLSREFGASGEEVIRKAGHIFGSERGSGIREAHLADGVPINLASFMGGSGLQERDPSEEVFVFAERQHLSPGAWYADCTYCPLAEVWGSDASDGYRLGSMFDEANHLGLYRSYHPGAVVRWDAIKSKGDSVCKFRFTIPELMTAEDPTPEEFDANVGGS